MKMCFIFSGFFWGVVLIVIGILIILKVFLRVDFPIFRILFSLLLIYIGIRVLIGGWRLKTIRNSVIFGESTIRVTKLAKEYNVIFGKGVIDLSQVELATEPTKVEINTVFGRGEVMINPELPTIIEVNSAFAEATTPDRNRTHFGKYTYRTEKYREGEACLRLEADVVFGSLEFFEK